MPFNQFGPRTTRQTKPQEFSPSSPVMDSKALKSLGDTLKSVQASISALDAKVDGLSKKVDQLSTLTSKLDEVSLSVADMRSSFENSDREYKRRFVEAEDRFIALESTITAHNTRISAMESVANASEEQQHVKDVIVSGIPSSPGENIHNLIQLIASKANHNITAFTDTFRIRTRSQSNPKGPIVVKFATLAEKRSFCAAVRNAKIKLNDIGFQSDGPINVSDSMTRSTRSIVPVARKYLSEGKIKRFFTRYSHLLIQFDDNATFKAADIESLHHLVLERTDNVNNINNLK